MPTRQTDWLLQFSSTVTSLVLWHNTFESPQLWKLWNYGNNGTSTNIPSHPGQVNQQFLNWQFDSGQTCWQNCPKRFGQVSKHPAQSQLFPSYTSGLVLWIIEFPLTDLTSQGTGNGWGWLIQRCLKVFSNDQLSKTLCRAALRSGDTVTSDRIERCCYC